MVLDLFMYTVHVEVHVYSTYGGVRLTCILHGAHVLALYIVNVQYMYVYMYIYVAVPRQDSMSAAGANAVLSGHCNRFVGYL